MIKKILMSMILACVSVGMVSFDGQTANAAIKAAPNNWGLHWIDAYVTINGKQYPAHIEWYGYPDKIELSTVTLYVRLGFPSLLSFTIIPGPDRILGPTITRIGNVDALPGMFPNNNPSAGKTPGMNR